MKISAKTDIVSTPNIFTLFHILSQFFSDSSQKRPKAGNGTPSARRIQTSHQTTRLISNSRTTNSTSTSSSSTTQVRPRSVSHDQYRITNNQNNYKTTVPDSSSTRRATTDNHKESHYNNQSKGINSSSSLKSTTTSNLPSSSSSNSPFASNVKYKHVAPPTQAVRGGVVGSSSSANANSNQSNSSGNNNNNSSSSERLKKSEKLVSRKNIFSDNFQQFVSRRNPSPRIAAEMAKMKIANSVNYR